MEANHESVFLGKAPKYGKTPYTRTSQYEQNSILSCVQRCTLTISAKMYRSICTRSTRRFEDCDVLLAHWEAEAERTELRNNHRQSCARYARRSV